MPKLPDIVLAAIFAAWALIEVLVGVVSGPWPVNVAAALGVAVPLAWRRARPEVAALAAVAVAAKTSVAVEMDGLALLAGVLLASWSVGRARVARSRWSPRWCS